MSAALGPLAVSSIAATISGAFPAFCTWRFLKNERDLPYTSQEKWTNYSIIATLTLLHLCEVAKSVYFGLEYSHKESVFAFVGRAGVKMVIDILAEAAHIMTILTVLQRMVGLVVPPQQLGSENRRELHVLLSFAIAACRAGIPILAFGIF